MVVKSNWKKSLVRELPSNPPKIEREFWYPTDTCRSRGLGALWRFMQWPGYIVCSKKNIDENRWFGIDHHYLQRRREIHWRWWQCEGIVNRGRFLQWFRRRPILWELWSGGIVGCSSYLRCRENFFRIWL